MNTIMVDDKAGAAPVTIGGEGGIVAPFWWSDAGGGWLAPDERCALDALARGGLLPPLGPVQVLEVRERAGPDRPQPALWSREEVG